VRRAADLEEAVGIARELGEPGDVVLLAPACASLDQFRSFEERGERFRSAVLSLVARESL
jgi:UDP-N-acetylmuramoylalanine--D-glutamate ligase